MPVLRYFSRQPRPLLLAWGIGLVVLVGVTDHLTGPDVSLALFYLLPVLLVAWFGGVLAGTVVAISVGVVTMLADTVTNNRTPGILTYWNAIVQVGLFLVVVHIAAAWERLRQQQEAARLADLQRTDALKTALLHAVSHDLRTPLASIKTSVTSLLEPSVSWDAMTRRELLEGVDEECDRLSYLVANLLDMSRIEGGILHLKQDWYSIGEVIHEVARRLRPRLAAYPLTLDVPADLPLLMIDFVRIDQVLTNLLENAIRHTPPGTAIRITARAGASGVEVNVADAGPGVAEEHLGQLFDHFFAISGSQQPQSSGLGLSIARGVVEAHGGTISARNVAGGGLCVTFTLPQVAPAAEPSTGSAAGALPPGEYGAELRAARAARN